MTERSTRQERLKRDRLAIERILGGMPWIVVATLAGITYRQLHNRIKNEVDAARKSGKRLAS